MFVAERKNYAQIAAAMVKGQTPQYLALHEQHTVVGPEFNDRRAELIFNRTKQIDAICAAHC